MFVEILKELTNNYLFATKMTGRQNQIKKADEEFNSLDLEEKKKALYTLIDKNKLYVNFSEINDGRYDISEVDLKFNKSFYYKEV